MAEKEHYVSLYRFRGIIVKPKEDKKPKEAKSPRIVKRIPVSPGKTAKLHLLISSNNEEELTQFRMIIRGAFPTASKIGKIQIIVV